MYLPVSEITCHSQTVIHHGDSLSRTQRSAWGFQFRLSVIGSSLAQFAEDGNYPADFFKGRSFCRKLHHLFKALHTAAHNIYFFINAIR